MIRKYFSSSFGLFIYLSVLLLAIVPFTLHIVMHNIELKEIYKDLFIVIIFLLISAGFYVILKTKYFSRLEKIIENIDSITSGKEPTKYHAKYNDEIDKLGNSIYRLYKDLSANIKDLKEYQRALDESNIVTKSDLSGRITYANEKFYEITGLTKEEVIGKPHNIVRHPDMPKEAFANMWETIKLKKVWRGVVKNRKKNGSYYIINATVLPILDENENIKEYIAIRHDITELEDSRREIEEMATVDQLTGLGNRNKLIADIQKASSPSLVILDIDRFSEVNDFYGHDIGDMLIEELSVRIASYVPREYGLYRYYADRFAILIDNTDQMSVESFAVDLRKKISNEHIVLGAKDFAFQTTTSISFDKNKNLIPTAEMALKYAKRNKHHIVLYSKELGIEKVYEENILWARKITDALKENRVVPYFQPILNLQNNKIEKYEALARMIDIDGKTISPFFFINAAKRSKQYLELTRTIFDQTVAKINETDAEISINLTIEDLLDKKHRDYIVSTIAKLPNNRIVLELVESEGIENFDDVSAFIREAKKAGAKIAIDDFGTGYSNFSYLLKLAVDYIKIDGSLIKIINEDKGAYSVVETIVDFAHKNNIKVIGEFASNAQILSSLKDIKIDFAQGFYIGEPNSNFEILKRD